jgi:WD repeat-containing protein 61
MRASTLHKIPGAHGEGIWCAAFIPGTSQLLTGSVDEFVKLWDISADPPTAQHTFTGHSLGAVSLAVDASGSSVACCALDSTVRVWDPAAAESKFNIESLPTESWGVAFGPSTRDAVRVAVAGGSKEVVTIYRGGAEDPVAEATLALPAVRGTFGFALSCQ